jgi:hypothetical protein
MAGKFAKRKAKDQKQETETPTSILACQAGAQHAAPLQILG